MDSITNTITECSSSIIAENVFSQSMNLCDSFLIATNATVVVISFIVAYVYGMRYYKGKLEGYARTITLGISLSSLGVGIHRIYWALQQFLENQESTIGISDFMNVTLIWITLVPLIVIMIGYGLNLSPYLKNAFKTTWIGVYAVLVGIVFTVFFLLTSI